MFEKGMCLNQLEALALLGALIGIAVIIICLAVVMIRLFSELEAAATRVIAAEAAAEMERARADKFGWRCVEAMKDARRERAVKEAALAELEMFQESRNARVYHLRPARTPARVH